MKAYNTLFSWCCALIAVCALPLVGSAQSVLQNVGSNITVSGSALLRVEGNLVNDGEITNLGSIHLTGDWTNNQSYTTDQGSVSFLGGSDQALVKNSPGPEVFHNLTVDKPGGKVRLQNLARVTNQLDLTQNNLVLENGPLAIDLDGTIVNASASSYIEADNGKSLNLEINSADKDTWLEFPVGDGTGYSPARLYYEDGSGPTTTATGTFSCQVEEDGHPLLLSGSSNYVDQQWTFSSYGIALDDPSNSSSVTPLEYQAEGTFASGDKVGNPTDVIEIRPQAGTAINAGGSVTSTQVLAALFEPAAPEVSITAGEGCLVPVSLSLSGPTSSYCGTNPPDISVSIDNGDPISNYVFAWSNGGNTATVTATAAGTYTVTVTESGGSCIGVASIQVDPNSASNAIYDPIAYYKFEGPQPLESTVDPTHTGVLGSNASVQSPSGTWGQYATSPCSGPGIGGTFHFPHVKKEFTMECLFRIKEDWSGSGHPMFYGPGSTGPISLSLFGHALIFQVYTASGVGNPVKSIKSLSLTGLGRNNISYWTDCEWHHMAVTVDVPNGEARLYLDGQLMPELTHQLASSTIDEIHQNWAASAASIGTYGCGDLDELVIYDKALPHTLIAKHYDNIQNNDPNPYHNTDDWLPCDVPAPDLSGAYTSLDPLDFPLDFDPDDFPDYNQCNLKLPIEQLKSFPFPRYEPEHGLTRNFPWFDYRYLAGHVKSGECTTQLATGGNTAPNNKARYKELQVEIAKHWNQYLSLNDPKAQSANDVQTVNPVPHYNYMPSFVEVANENPELPKAVITLWNGAQPQSLKSYSQSNNSVFGTAFIGRKDLDCEYYEWSEGKKQLHPMAHELPAISIDGMAQAEAIGYVLDEMNQGFDFLNENGEVGGPVVIQDADCSTNPYIYTTDPCETATTTGTTGSSTLPGDAAAGCSGSWHDWTSEQRTIFRQKYRDAMMAHPSFANTRFSWFALDGKNGHTHVKFDKGISIQKGDFRETSGNNPYRYSTPDIYPLYPYRWMIHQGAWRGLEYAQQAREGEISLNGTTVGGIQDAEQFDLFSPFVTAGFGDNYRSTLNVRPAQYLGLLKILSVYGAEFFYVGYFNESAVASETRHPSFWSWQVVAPSYVQAITSRKEFRNILLDGEIPDFGQGRMYRLPAGKHLNMVAARKRKGQEEYIISGTRQTVTNQFDPTSGSTLNQSKQEDVTIDLDGQNLTFNIRRQGSTYYFNKLNQDELVFYQLDGWHDYGHMDHWSPDFNLEAELFDRLENNGTTANETWFARTELNGGGIADPAVNNIDFTDSETYLTFRDDFQTAIPTLVTFDPDNAPTVTYTFRPASEADDFKLYVKAKKNTAGLAETGMYVRLVDVATQQVIATDVIQCVTNTNWEWYGSSNCDDTPILYTTGTGGLLEVGEYYEIRISPINNNLDIDQILLDDQVSVNPPSPLNTTTCTASMPALVPDFIISGTCEPIELLNRTNYVDDCETITWTWTITDPNSAVTTYSTRDVTNFTPGVAGTFTIDLEASYSGGNPVVSKTITIAAGPTPNPATNSVTGIVGQQVQLQSNFTGGTGPLTYSWIPEPRVDDPIAEDVWATLIKPEPFTVTATDNNGCTAVQVFNATLSTTAPISVTLTSSCGSYCNTTPPSSCVLTANAADGVGGYTYKWYDGPIMPANLINTTTSGINGFGQGVSLQTMYPGPGQSHYWTVVVSDVNGHTASASSAYLATPDCKTDVSGDEETSPDDQELLVGAAAPILEAFPNPFRDEVNIVYHLPEDAEVELAIYNAVGVRVAHQPLQYQSNGQHQYRFDTFSINRTPGLYIVRLMVNGEVLTKRIVQM